MTGMPIPHGRGPMIKDAPDHHDADLVLKLYDLRREASMRVARTGLTAEFWPATAEDAIAIVKPDHPHNLHFRQFTGYWEMAYSMARHGIVNPDYLAETSGEGLFVYAKFEPWLKELRTAGSPRYFLNTEWLATHCEMGRTLMSGMRPRIAQMTAARRGT
jgi:hypothetical protein